MASVKYNDLLDAFMFVSGGIQFESSAYICVDTGAVYWLSSEVEPEEDVPDDLETSDRYIAIPHQNDLNLGRNLALSFVEQELPDDYDAASGYFRSKGAYSRFKQLLESRDQLERWYLFEENAVKEALLAWCEEHGIRVEIQAAH